MMSHKFKTIFVHIPKTAGRSIDCVFIREHELNWESRASLLLRPNSDPSRGPCFLTHLFAREYVSCGYIDACNFAAMFKFAVVRHPYDRFISEFRWRRSLPETPPGLTMASLWSMKDTDPFSDEARHLAPQIEFVSDEQGKIIVDKVLRFEHLAEQLKPVFELIFGYAPSWTLVNKSPGMAIERDYLDHTLKRQLFKAYEADFDTFSYSSGFVA